MWKGLALLAANEVGTSIKRNMTGMAFYGVAGLLACIAAGFGLVALMFWLETFMSRIEASLSIALGLVVLAGMVALFGRYYKSRPANPTALKTAALVAGPLAAQMVGRRLNVGTVALVGVVALGALLGRNLSKD